MEAGRPMPLHSTLETQVSKSISDNGRGIAPSEVWLHVSCLPLYSYLVFDQGRRQCSLYATWNTAEATCHIAKQILLTKGYIASHLLKCHNENKLHVV